MRDCGEVVGGADGRFAVLLLHSASLLRSAGNQHRTGTCVIPFTGDLWLRFSLRRSISRPWRAGPLRGEVRSLAVVSYTSRFLFFFIARIPNRIALHYATGWPRPSRVRHSRQPVIVPPIARRIVRSGADQRHFEFHLRPSSHLGAALPEGRPVRWGVTKSGNK